MRYISRLQIFILLLNVVFAQAQVVSNYKIHSHNDYEQKVPFWNAYANGANSIEIDVFLVNDELFVAHAENEIQDHLTFKSLYLESIEKALSLNLGEQQDIQFLIDIKSDANTTLAAVIEQLELYPSILKNPNIKFVISGNRPATEDYAKYPPFIYFDYQSVDPLTEKEWEKVALISLPYSEYSVWNGKGRMVASELDNVKKVVSKAHSYNKPFRFWGTPDSKSAWKALYNIGVDFINTDKPFKCQSYLSSIENRESSTTIFSEVYTPSFVSDNASGDVENVILLIGDGNGLTQISAAALANGGSLTLTQLKNIGFIRTQSADDFTTDSAAAGTALATGSKTNNRYIGVNSNGEPLKNITEVLSKHNFKTGIITTDAVTGATPSAFYAHQDERDLTSQIAADLWKSKLSLFAGGDKKHFNSILKDSPFTIIEDQTEIGTSKADRIGYFISENGVPSILDGRQNELAEITKQSLTFLSGKNTPFFLMVEAAQIDSFGHTNNTGGIITEGIDFDRAITEAIKFADNHKNTLVIITADHETSGFGIPQGDMEAHQIEGDFLTHDHTGVMVPVFAYGPKSELFTGVYENTEIYTKILNVLNIKQ